MNTFSHIAYHCRNLAAQEAFYTRHFGFKRCRTFNRGTPGEFFLLKLGSMRLEFFSAKADTDPSAKGGEQAIGFRHIALEVASLEPIVEALRTEGVDLDPIQDVSHIVPGLRIVFFRDPEGNIVELLEGYHDDE